MIDDEYYSELEEIPKVANARQFEWKRFNATVTIFIYSGELKVVRIEVCSISYRLLGIGFCQATETTERTTLCMPSRSYSSLKCSGWLMAR